MTDEQNDSVRKLVREGYAKIAQETSAGCCGPGVSCCGSAPQDADKLARELGYSVEELKALPDGANMGLSCGNPAALAALKPGEIVLDLGSGGGFDVFIAGRKVGADRPRHRRGHDAGNARPRRAATSRITARKPAWTTSSSASAKSSICRSPTTAWTSSSPTASSIFRPTNRRSGAKWRACSSPAGAWPCPTWRCSSRCRRKCSRWSRRWSAAWPARCW